MANASDWIIALYAGVGLGVFLIGAGLFVVCLRLAGLLGRASSTLGEVDRQIAALTPPIVETLTHVGGIADTADATLARLTTVVDAVEGVAGGVMKSAAVAQHTFSPAVANMGAAFTAASVRLRRFVAGRSPAEATSDVHVDL